MVEFVLSILEVIRVFLRSRSDTALEVLALRQQVAVLKRKGTAPVSACTGVGVADLAVAGRRSERKSVA